MEWTSEAEEKMREVPESVRDMARRGVEKIVEAEGRDVVTPADVNAAREQFLGDGPDDDETLVAIVRCDRVSEVCPGVGCLSAFNDRRVYFEDLGPARLVGVFTCGACPGRRVPRLLKSLARHEYKPDVVYMSSCMFYKDDYPRCPHTKAIKRAIESKDIRVVEGTHH